MLRLNEWDPEFPGLSKTSQSGFWLQALADAACFLISCCWRTKKIPVSSPRRATTRLETTMINCLRFFIGAVHLL